MRDAGIDLGHGAARVRQPSAGTRYQLVGAGGQARVEPCLPQPRQVRLTPLLFEAVPDKSLADSVSLRQQTSNANEKKSSSHIHLAGQQPAIQTQHDLRKGVGWLLQGLRIELAKPSSDSPTAGDTYDSSGFEDEPLQLEVVNDLAQSLTSLYRYGKLKPPQSHQQSSTSGPGKHDTSDLWIEGADLAAELVQHPSIKVDVGHDAPTGYFDAFRPTANRCEVGSPTDFKDPKCRDARCVHLDPPARLRRSCNVHLFYLLALSRFPFHSPPSTPSLSAPSTPIATVPYASPLGSSTGSGGHHWGHAEAQKYWSLIIHVSRLPGGVGTREGEAIVVKAQRRLGLLDDAAAREVVEPVTPSGAVELPHGHVLAHHQSPESVEGAFLQSPTVSAVTQQPLHQNGSSSRPVKLRNDSSSSSGGQSRSKKEATTPLGLSPAQELAEEVKAMDAKRSSSSRSTTPVPSASGSKHAFPTASTPTSDDTVHHPTLDRLRGRHKSRPRLRSTLSRDIFLGDRDRTYSAPAVPSLSSLSASAGPSSLSRHLTPTTFLSIEHAGLHDSKGKHVPGREGLLSQPSMQHLAGDGRSTFSRRLRNDSFASLASLDAPSVFSTTSAFPSTTAPGTTTSFRQRAGSTVSSIRSWRPSLPQAFAPRAAVTSTNRPAIQVLERALKRDADARMGWTWAETEMDPDEEEALESSAATTVDGGEGADDTRDWGTADGGLQESPRTQQSEEPASDSTLASSGSTAPTSIPASGSTSRTSPDRPTPPVAESPSSKKGKIFVPVTKPHNRQPLTAPGTPRASRERRAIDRRLQSASYSSKLGNPTSSTHLSPLASGGDKSGSTSGTSGSDEDGPPRTLKSKMSMDPLLAALEEQSRVNVKVRPS